MLLTKDYFPAVILLFNCHILVPRWTRSDYTDANTYGEYYALFYTHICDRRAPTKNTFSPPQMLCGVKWVHL